MTSQSLDTKQSEYTYYPIFREGNQTMKFGQLRMLTREFFFFFFEKLYTKCDGKTSPRSFSKKLKLSISLDQSSKVLYSLLLLYAKLRVIEAY